MKNSGQRYLIRQYSANLEVSIVRSRRKSTPPGLTI